MTTKINLNQIKGAAINPLDYWSSGDVGAAFNAAIAAMPSTGGVLDCRGMVGAYTASTTVTINKPVEILLGAATITWSVAPAITQTTGASLVILGAGAETSFLATSANGHLISAVATGVSNSRFVMENVGLLDTLTIQTGSTFSTWSSTRTLGSAIYVSGTGWLNIKNVRSFGFLHCLDVVGITTSTFDNIMAQWGVSHHFLFGINCTSLVFNGCYSFASGEDGYHFIGNIQYTTLNSCASDSAGKYGYYFGPDPTTQISPIDFTINSCGSEGCGVVTPFNWANILLDGVRSFTLNDCTLIGLGNTVVNTCDGLRTAETSDLTSQVTINGGHYGVDASPGYFGGYALNFPTATTTKSKAIIVARNPSTSYGLAGGSVAVSPAISDPDGALFYSQGYSDTVLSLATATWQTIFTIPSYAKYGAWIITASADAGGTVSL